MKPSIRRLEVIAGSAIFATLSVAVLVHPMRTAFSQQTPAMHHAMPGQSQMPGMLPQQMMQMHGQGPAEVGAATPSMPGQAAFGAIQEVVRILEADPTTDWSKIDLEALRQHLIDMNEVTLEADAVPTSIDGGLTIIVTGDGRTLAAIQRMVPAHARELNQMNGWSAKTEALPNGERLTVTSNDPKEVQHIRGLGFIGLLVSGSHHQPHHLAIAKGTLLHTP